jgi:hypothetical protein
MSAKTDVQLKEQFSTGKYLTSDDYSDLIDTIPKIVVLTQTEYDSLATKDPNTIYFIPVES